MFLYLVQHAEALSRAEDPALCLSDKGIEDITEIAHYLSKLNLDLKQILHSGKMRALQTAQILADNIASGKYVSDTDGLAPNDNPGIWLDRISKLTNNVLLVGHLPHLGKLLALILSGEEMDMVNFENGCVICLKRSEDGNWAIEWIIKPGMIK